MRVYKFQLKPNGRQEIILDKQFDLCRFTYNQLLDILNKQDKINKNEIQHEIINLKIKYPELKDVYSKTLQYECYRLFVNLKSLGVSKKKGRKVGALRFKGKKWFKTIVYNQKGFKLIKTNNHYNILKLSKIGNIKIRQHRQIDGNIKGIVIKRKISAWEAHIITDVKYTIASGKDIIGIDMGITSFITTSDNIKIDNPKYMNKSLIKLQHIHRKISKTKKGSNNRYKRCMQLQKVWETVDNQKKDYFHKITTQLINQSRFISVEKLNIKGMLKEKKQRYVKKRNIADSSWGLFLGMLKFKAENAGIKYIEVDPTNTSKMCSNCGNIKDMPLYIREYKCQCGFIIDRDHNAAINILRKGFASVGEDWLQPSMNQEAITSTC